jgi:FAD/FMN-containing dehydrogenase
MVTMRAVGVDADARRVRVEAGVTWGEVNRALEPHGLAALAGSSHDVGVVGYTLGGGYSWLARSQGLAASSVLAIELVTPDGRLQRVDAEHSPDLFWALRGGGGNFGVVVAIEFRVYPVATVVGGMLLFPLERAREVLRAYAAWAATAPDAATTCVRLLRFPPMPELPEFLRGQALVGIDGAIDADDDTASALLAPLRALGPTVDTFGRMPATSLTDLHLDPPSPVPAVGDGAILEELTDETIDALVDAYAAATSPLSVLVIEQMGGAVARVPRDATAFPNRDAAFNLAMVGRWTDPGERDTHVRWVRGVHDAVRPSALGAYVNYLGVGEGADRVRAAYGPEKFARLASLKRAYDPSNVFRFNQNIPPA